MCLFKMPSESNLGLGRKIENKKVLHLFHLLQGAQFAVTAEAQIV